jgi:hypothetical protein
MTELRKSLTPDPSPYGRGVRSVDSLSHRERGDRRRRWVRLAFLISALCSLISGSANASGEPDAFALPGVGARPGGMGGAFIGLSDDIESVYYNPAGLGNLTHSGVTSMYQTSSLETSRGFVAFNKAWTHPVLPGSVALGWLRLQSNNIELTSLDEQVLGTTNLSNDLLLLGVGVHPFEHISLGMSVKYYRFYFDGFQESGVGYDLGAHVQYGFFRFGLAMTDLDGTTVRGPSIDPTQPDATDKVPARFRPGIALVFNQLLGLPIDIDWDGDEIVKLQGAQETRLFTGMELWGFTKHAALRGGYQEASGPTLGASLRIGSLQFDYSYLISLHLQDENRLGLSMHF